MKIQVLGTGCPKCKKTAEIMKEAAVKLGLADNNYELEKVEKINDIMKFGIIMTPGVVIDGKVITSGQVPTLAEATTMIVNRLAQEEQ
jgi:small redox-active disulfide protein 2